MNEFVAFIVAIVIAVAAAFGYHKLNEQPPLEDRRELAVALQKTPEFQKMKAAGAYPHQVSCVGVDEPRMFVAVFRFDNFDARKEEVVYGETACEGEGRVMAFTTTENYSAVYTREPYSTAERIAKEVFRLFEKGNFQRDARVHFDLDRAKALQAKFDKQLERHRYSIFSFNCPAKGEPYEYVASHGDNQIKGDVKALCQRTQTKFEFRRSQQGQYIPLRIEPEYLEFRDVPETLVEQALREALDDISSRNVALKAGAN